MQQSSNHSTIAHQNQAEAADQYTVLPVPAGLLRLENSQIVSTDVDIYFKCCLCQRLVSPLCPLECSQCHVVFCEQCIDEFITERIIFSSQRKLSNTCSTGQSTGSTSSTSQYLIHSGSLRQGKEVNSVRNSLMMCPQGCLNLTVQPLHHFANQILSKTLLLCPMTRPNGEGCQTKLRYEDYLQHVTQHCCELKIQCNCGKQVRKKEFALHLSEECPNVTVLCKRCNLNMPRKHLHQNLDECLLALMKTNEKILRDLEDIKFKPAP